MTASFASPRGGYPTEMPPAALLDVDGTLVDSTYHHAIAWARAFRERELVVPLWRIHRHIGMGGDQLVAAVCEESVERDHGDELRDLHSEQFKPLIDEVLPFEGASELIAELDRRGHAVVLASSADSDECEHYIDLMDVRELIGGWTTSADVEKTKPEPDLVLAALEKAGGGPAVMVGDATFDCEAAQRAGLKTIGLLTGGFSAAELRDAGAGDVFASLIELREGLDATALSAPAAASTR
jgi:HAD superfamily hydrolase (TIGR01549 family)